MTDDAINQAIAETCGWRKVDVFEWQDGARLPKQFHASGALLPNYCSDLNAMNEAEKTLPDDNSMCGLVAYCNKLAQICGTHRACVTATARQRAEAFLRTLGKWKE